MNTRAERPILDESATWSKEDEQNVLALSELHVSIIEPSPQVLVTASQLEIKKRVGKGSFATVYKAFVRGCKEPFALKVINKGQSVLERCEHRVETEV